MSRVVFQYKVLEEFKKNPRGTIFTNSDFLNYAKFGTINKILMRLVEEKEIVRIAEGFYTIPEYSDIIKAYILPTPTTFALKVADKHSWKISPTGDTALNAIGLSTQISNRYLYLSDGPYRIYEYEGRMIEFRHTTNRMISKHSKEFNLLIQAIKMMGKGNIGSDNLRKLKTYFNNFISDDFINYGKKLPAWIYEEMRIISGEKRSSV